ncbi:unnamed protein product, partial [Nesidiocoris tenuis]
MFDDIIVTGVTEAEHDRNVEEVLRKARKFNIKFNPKKLQYKQEKVKYLGLIFASDGICPDEERVRAITEIETPTCVRELQRFLGAVNFINKFIPSFSKVTSNLRILLKKTTPWKWTKLQQEAFDTLKKLVSTAPTLKTFNPKQPIQIQCDASKEGM